MTSQHRRKPQASAIVHGGSGKAEWTHLYNKRKWRAYSKAFRESRPLCVRCQAEGRLVPTQVCDHIVSHRGDLGLFWDTANHQPLCKRCHDLKSAKEDGGGRQNLPASEQKANAT